MQDCSGFQPDQYERPNAPAADSCSQLQLEIAHESPRVIHRENHAPKEFRNRHQVRIDKKVTRRIPTRNTHHIRELIGGPASNQDPQRSPQRIKYERYPPRSFANGWHCFCSSPELHLRSYPIPKHKYKQEEHHHPRLNPKPAESNSKFVERLRRSGIDTRRKIQTGTD